ncbi:MAG: GTPase Era [Myxococcota bacterium]|jgi:GTP-binding protein Era|nr:GTPase Era [Myxococcota bacterium]
MADEAPVQRAGFVAVLGRPNVGKSTLLNQVLGTKLSVVTPRPQTTRNRIRAIHEVPGAQLVFVDTPGIHKPRTELNRAMVDAAWAAMADADAGVLVVEAVELPEGKFAPGAAVEAILERLTSRQLPTVLAINKIDRIPRPALLPLIDGYRQAYPFAAIVPICALTGDGVATVVQELVPLLPTGDRLFPGDQLSDRAQRFFVSELIREQVFLQTREEVPYGCAVVIDKYEEARLAGRRTEILATIVVDEARHRAILVGKGGQQIKALGIASRQAIETFLEQPVILKLFVKVRQDWTKTAKDVRDLGNEP